jgi:hypothetical protein
MRHLIACCLLVGTVVTALPATAAKRVALVIGNSAYQYTAPLPNPVNDSRAVAEALRRLDFVVIEAIDQDKPGMKRLLRQFSAELQDADASLFFYAGHGMQVEGQNYLVPVDAALESEVDLPFEAVAVDAVLNPMEKATPLRLVFLDACRDNPLARSLSRGGGVGRGLARMDSRAGTLIAFATEPDKVALDGDGEHSPFTLALLEHIETPGIEVRQMLSRVRATVIDNTGGEQLPLDSSALVRDFYFMPPAPPAPPAPAPVAAAPPSFFGAAPTDEQLFWQSIQTSTDPNDFRAYLESFPDGVFAPLARNRLNLLSASQSQVAALTPPTQAPPAATPPAAPPVPPVAESIEVEPMDATVVATRNVNVRAAPNTGGDTLGAVAQGTEVAVVGKVVGVDWYQIVRPDGGLAYVYAPLFVRPTRSTAAVGEAAAPPPAAASAQTDQVSQPAEPAQATYAAPSTIDDPALAGIEQPATPADTPGALATMPQAIERDLPSSPSRRDQFGAASTKEPASGGPIALFESPGAEESLTRSPADAEAEKPLQTEEIQQRTRKAEVPANTLHARLEEEPRKEASPDKGHRIILSEVKDRSECEAFLDGVYEDGLRDNASRFQTCQGDHRSRGSEALNKIVFYQQPGCKDPIWSQMKGPERCRPLVEYACEVFRRKSDLLAECDKHLAKR